ncbi:hypothetical protein [Hyphobacterium marinum]|uniref:Uncharacterized protein n=1 Tax=Hyphobacterium marinum TaxID=3116574 RepID=A0ABU7LZW4_9PROT|nr:hypothetical protein [Hyphobacterium sp. Y6023]MEE2567088.1 hypothetical protein [Hyphobacterium sp. Y6023]
MLDLIEAAWLMTTQVGTDRTWDEVLGTEVTEDWQSAEHRQYDFWTGRGEGNWRPREEAGLGHVEDGQRQRHYVFPALDGKAIIEIAEPRDLTPGEAQGRGFSIRYYNEAAGRWVMAQHWPNPQFDGIVFLDQLTGEEHHGRIAVYSADMRAQTPEGEPQIRRYQFSDIRADGFRWDGANTADGGETWRTWMVVDFQRLGDMPSLPAAGEPLPGYSEGLLCQTEPHGALDGLVGEWSGEAVSANGDVEPARFTAGHMLDGCAIAGVIERPESGYRGLLAWSYTPILQRWIAFYLNNTPRSPHLYFASETAGEGASFFQLPAVIADERTPFITNARAGEDTARARTVWETLNEAELVWRVEYRGQDGNWQPYITYRFARD